MNDELQKALAVMLQKTTQATEAGAAFLQAELPEVIRQLLMWHAVKSALLCAMFAALVPATWIAAKKLESMMAKDTYAPHGIAYFFGCIVMMGCFTGFVSNFDWLQILLAPKVYLIECAAHLVKK